MKHIISIRDLIGTEIHTRFSLNPLKTQLIPDDEYLIDMDNVEMISRSAADELFTMAQEYKMTLVHLSEFVRLMMDAVAVGRFTPRELKIPGVTFIKCDTIESLNEELKKLSVTC